MAKLADRITNLQPPPGHWDAQKIKQYREEGRVILKELGKACVYLAERLNLKIRKYGD